MNKRDRLELYGIFTVVPLYNLMLNSLMQES